MELKHPSSDKVTDEKIKRLINQAARVRASFRFIEKLQTGKRRDDLPTPRGFKPKSYARAGKSETGEQK
jgi:hypothetical protein